MLKVVIAGCGFISVKKHIPAFLKLGKKIKIAAVCDLNSELVKKIARDFHIAEAYTDFSGMLLKERPDIVDICTPPGTHAKLAVEAIESGCHVLLEKPMALELGDCDRMMDAVKQYKKEIFLMHNQVFNPAWIRAKELFKKGIIGDFLGIEIFLSTPVDYMTSSKNHWAHQLPGGVLGETGPHAVYLALDFLKDVESVDIRTKKVLKDYPWSNFEDFRINLIAQNGRCSITLNYASNQWQAEAKIIGSKGILKIDLEAQSVICCNRRNLNAFSLGLSELSIIFQELNALIANGLEYLFGQRKDSHSIGIQQCLESILKDEPPVASASCGRETVRIMRMVVDKLNNQGKQDVYSRD